jgi:hypothetical protein
LPLANKTRELALFDLALDSKLRGCNLVVLHVSDVAHGGHVLSRATVVQRKTKQPVRFELTDQTRAAVGAWIVAENLSGDDYLSPSRLTASPHLSTRQYARIVKSWAALIGADPHDGDGRCPANSRHSVAPVKRPIHAGSGKSSFWSE